MQPNVLRPSAAKAEALLGEVLAADPDNPLALHLHIHITEASAPSRSVLTCLQRTHTPKGKCCTEAYAEQATKGSGSTALHVGTDCMKADAACLGFPFPCSKIVLAIQRVYRHALHAICALFAKQATDSGCCELRCYAFTDNLQLHQAVRCIHRSQASGASSSTAF